MTSPRLGQFGNAPPFRVPDCLMKHCRGIFPRCRVFNRKFRMLSLPNNFPLFGNRLYGRYPRASNLLSRYSSKERLYGVLPMCCESQILKRIYLQDLFLRHFAAPSGAIEIVLTMTFAASVCMKVEHQSSCNPCRIYQSVSRAHFVPASCTADC